MNQITPCSMPTLQEKRPITEVRMISNTPYPFIQLFWKISFSPDIEEEVFRFKEPDTTFFYRDSNILRFFTFDSKLRNHFT